MNHTHEPVSSTVGHFATITLAGLWMTLKQAFTHGPDWGTLPPLLLALSALIGAIRAAQNDAYRRRKGTLQ